MTGKKPKLRDHIVVREEDFGAILFDPQRGRMHRVNKTGLFIVQRCDGERTVDEIVSELASSESVSKEKVAEDVGKFLSSLQERELIEWR